MGWKKSAPYGASDLAKIRAGFLHKAERLLHGAQIAQNLENSDKWSDRSHLPTRAGRPRKQGLGRSGLPSLGSLWGDPDLGENRRPFTGGAQVGVSDPAVNLVTENGHFPRGDDADFDGVMFDAGYADFNAISDHDALPLAPA